MPEDCNEGPMARMITFFEAMAGGLLSIVKPLIMTSPPVPTRERTEMFNGWAWIAVTRKICPEFPRVR